MSKIQKVVLGVVVCLIAVYFITLRLFMPGFLQSILPQVQTQAAAYLNGRLEIENLSVSNSLTLTARGLSVYDVQGREVAASPEIDIRFNLLRGIFSADPVKAVELITVKQPILRLQIDDKNEWNIATLIKSSDTTENSFIGTVCLENGSAQVNSPEGEWNFGVDGSIDARPNPNYDLNFTLTHDQDTLKMTGRIDSDVQGKLLVRSKKFVVTPFAVLVSKYFGVDDLQGQVSSLNMIWSSEQEQVRLEGGGTLQNIAALVHVSGRDLRVTANGKVAFSEKQAEALAVQFTVGGEKGRLDGKIDFSDSEKPQAKDLYVEFDKFNVQNAIADIPVAGTVSGYLIANGPLSDLQLNGLLTSDEITYENYHLSNLKVPLASAEGFITTPGAQADWGGGQVILYGEYELAQDIFSLAADFKNVDVSPSIPSLTRPAVLTGAVALTGQWQEEFAAEITTGDLALNYGGVILNNINGDFRYEKDNIEIKNLAMHVNDQGTIAAAGIIQGSSLNLTAQMSDIPLAPFLELEGQTGRGVLSGVLSVNGSLQEPTVDGIVRLAEAEVYQQKIKKAYGKIQWANNRLHLDGLEMTMEQGKHLVEGTIDFVSVQPRVDLRVKTQGVRVEPLVALVKPDLKLTGNLDNELSIRGSIEVPTVTGTMLFYDGSFEGFLIDKVTGNYSYVNQNLNLDNIIIDALSTEIILNGSMDKEQKLNFDLSANQIDLKKIVSFQKPEINGFGNLTGQITGTLERPLFEGKFRSDSILVNGEEFTNIAGDFNSLGGIFNTLKGKAMQGQGSYDLDLTLDVSNAFLQGTIIANGGEVESLLKMADLPYNIKGELYGTIDINRAGKGSGVRLTGDIRNCSIRGIKYATTNFDATLQKNILMINKLYAQEDTQGFMAAQGTINFNNRDVALEVFSSDANAALLTAFMQNPIEFGGKMNFAAQISGTIEKPEANASLAISQGSVADVQFDNFYGMVTLRDDIFKLEQLFIQKDIYKASAYGTVPYDLFRVSSERINPEAQMDITVKLDNANLAILPSLNKSVESGNGDTKGEVYLKGTLENPLITGSLGIDNGIVKIKNINTPIENLNVSVVFEGTSLRLEALSAKIGANGILKASGNLGFMDSTENYKLDVQSSNVAIDSSIFKGIINGIMTVTPQKYGPPGGEQRIRPFVTGELRFDKVLINMPTIPEFGEGDSNIGLDVKIVLGPEIHLYNKYLYDLWLTGGLHIKGSTMYTNIDGSVAANKGTVTYLRTPFKIRRAIAGFPTPGSVLPTINLDAATKFGRYNVNMSIDGPLEQMQLTLTSDPPLTQQELFRMLTLKNYNNTGTGTGDNGLNREELQALVDVGLEMTFLGDVENMFKEELNLDQFRIYSGNTASGVGYDLSSKDISEFTQEEREQYNILVAKYVTDRVLLGYASSLNGKTHNAFTQYEVNDNVVMNFSLDEDNRKWVGVEYHRSF